MAGIYIHIPFCRQACTYCNFHFSTLLKYKSDMIAAMLKELELSSNYLGSTPVETIYFGGGTPSLLSADEINIITDRIFKLYNTNPLKEFTLETNPDDLTANYIESLRHTHVDRFSIGVQSFRDNDLRYMNRAHNAQQADRAIKTAQDSGFTNLTIDLIYGVPGAGDADWKANLTKVKELDIPHFSAYALTVEEGTVLHNNIKKKKTAPVDAEQSATQFEILMHEAASSGFEHYEISNFARNGKYAVHNTNYWKGIPYLGIGPSAHSFDGNSRKWNIANNALYMKNILVHNTVLCEDEHLTETQRVNEYIMTSLRTMWGCNIAMLGSYTGQIMADARQFIDSGKILLQDNRLVLSNEGKLFADRIASELFVGV